MGPSEGLDSLKYRAEHRDTSDMDIMAQDGVVYVEKQELVED